MTTHFIESITQNTLDERERCLMRAFEQVLTARRWSREQLRAAQFAALSTLVEAAYEHLPFYRDKYDTAGFHPGQLRGFNDLPRIPLLTKDELRRAELFRLPSTADNPDVRLLASSGSTGMALRIYRDDASLWHFTAYNTSLYYQWCNHKPLVDVLYCVDMATDSIDFALADLLRTTVAEERLLPVTAEPEEIIARIDDLRPTFISTYPSTLRAVAIALDRCRRTYEYLQVAHLTSEMLDDATRRLLRRVFPKARLVETYTSTEAGLVGYRCPKTEQWHLAEDGLIPEIVDKDGIPTEGLGRLVVTDLTNRATPIIRYAGLGDLCRWEPSECACGTVHRSLAELAGRVADLIALPDGRTLSPYAVTNALEEMPAIYQYQVVQQTHTMFEVLIVRQPTAGIGKNSLGDTAICQAVSDCLRAAVGSEATCVVRLVEKILPRPGAHKIPLVVSHLPRSS
jgi:phenylacetate-CoA ligase